MSGENTARDYSDELNSARKQDAQMPKMDQMNPSDFHVPQNVAKNNSADNYSQNENVENRSEKLDADRKQSSVKDKLNEVKNIASVATPVGALSLLKQINLLSDMPYVAAIGAAVLKDLLDLAFIGSLPGLGTVITLLCTIFIFMMMLLAGSGGKRKAVSGMFKKGGVLLGGTIFEMIMPGLNLVPMETLTVAVVYFMTLVERKNAPKK